MASFGYSGSAYDQWINNQNPHMLADSTLDKMQHQFWVTKQTVLRKFGKKEDECITASDAELDAKLDLFRSIQETCHNLDHIIERYQERLLVLAQEEAAMGRFLKEQGKTDKTRAGKMLVAVGKVMAYSAQQRTALRTPLARLYQEVDTFCQRAVQDSGQTIQEMEKCRNEYRGALMWMKNVSQELDPDTFKQLGKFRKVQGQVKDSKRRFDRHKLACLQKVDLLAAARCNMFSHGLILYQKNLMQCWEKTSKAMTTVSNSFKGYQYYEFSAVKELAEPSKKLSERSEEMDGPFFFESEFRDDELLDKNDSSSSLGKGKEKSKAKEKGTKPKSTHSERDEMKSKAEANLMFASDELLQELGLLDLHSPAQPGDDLFDPPTDAAPKSSLENLLNLSDLEAIFGDFQSTAPVDHERPLLEEDTSLLDLATPATFMPSQLLDWNPAEPLPPPPVHQPTAVKLNESRTNVTAPAKKANAGKDMASWYSLFADLDPLANPDAVGSNRQDNNDRNC